jgi:diguanylate cyclase (GGDEF)-like protein
MMITRTSGVLLLVLMTVILLMVSNLLSENHRDKGFPTAVDGSFDLRPLSLNKTKSIPINGEWRFDPQQLVLASEINQITEPAFYISVPSVWNNQVVDKSPLAGEGYGTHSVFIQLDKEYPQLSLKMPIIGTAYRVYVNDELLSSAGVVSAQPEKAQSSYEQKIINFVPPSSEFTIVVQVSNYGFFYGGIWQEIRIGLPEALQQEQGKVILQSTFMIAIFFTICGFNFIQFSLSTNNSIPLLIACICILLAFRELEQSQVLYLVDIYYIPFDWSVRINYLSFYGAMPLALQYFKQSYSREYNKRIIQIMNATCIGFCLTALLTPVSFFSPFMPVFQMFAIFVLLYMTIGIVMAVRRKRKHAKLMLIGTLVFLILALNDILLNLEIIDSVSLTNFGLVAFVMCQNYVIYSVFIAASKENQYLNIKLQQRNKELEKFSLSLEQQVTLRTSELANVNKKLQSLANEDPLTGLLNRRGLMQHIEQAKINYDQNKQPFCLVLIDFDEFKLLNDTLGHDIGDKVLSSSSDVIRESIRAEDTAGRWGGEEFLVLIANTKIELAIEIAERIRKDVEQKISFKVNQKVSITVGIAQCEVNESIESCLKRADNALYKGKARGKNQVQT